MKEEFYDWLVNDYGLSPDAARARVSSLERIQEYYPELDEWIADGKIDNLLRDLSYSSSDERNGREPEHRIPIYGNKRTGSATHKQSLNRYIEFCRTRKAQQAGYSEFQTLFEDIVNTIRGIKLPSRKRSFKRNDVKELIQIPILNALEAKYPKLNWSIEAYIDETDKTKDRVDVMGQYGEDSVIVIEIDTYRADQLSKKYVSRMAHCDSKNVGYIAVCYPNTNAGYRPGKKESLKYEQYMNTLTALIQDGTSLEKYFKRVCLA